MIYFDHLMEFRKRILKIGLPALISRGTMVIWGILNIFIIRQLPEEAYAIFGVAKSFEMFGLLIGGGFVKQAILKYVSEGSSQREKQLANAGILLTVILSLISSAVLLLMGGMLQSFYGALDLSGIPILLAGIVITGNISGLPRALLLTEHRTKDVMISDLIQFAVKSGALVYLLVSRELHTAHQIFAIMIVSNLVAFGLSSWFAKGLFFPDAGVTPRRVRQVLSFALVTLGTSLANFIYTRTDILILGKIAPGDVAPYSACRSFSGMILVVVTAANMVLMPLISRMWKQGQRSVIMLRVWSTVMLAEFIMLPIVSIYVFFPRQILDFLYDGKYTDGWPIIVVLGLVSLIRPIGSFFSTASAAAGKPQYSLYGVIISSIVNVGLNLLLIPKFKGFGAALATAVAVAAGTLWIYISASRYIKKGDSTNQGFTAD